MRTTLNLDDDVYLAVRERARRERRAAGQVLSDLARESLTGRGSTSGTLVKAENGFHALPSRGGIVTNELVQSLLDEEP